MGNGNETRKHKADFITHRYVVNAVGDANCIWIDKTKYKSNDYQPHKDCHFCFDRKSNVNCQKRFCIDFGYSDTDYFEYIKCQAFEIDEFLLSHYHKDHYNGLDKINNSSLAIENLYYPYIPKIEGRPDYQQSILQYSHFLNTLSILNCDELNTIVHNDEKIKTKVIGLWLIALLLNKNKFEDFNYATVYQGMRIFDDEYQIIWPPREIPYDSNYLQSLETGIKTIETVLATQPESIQKVWDIFHRTSKFDENQMLSIEQSEDFWNRIKEIKIKDDNPDNKEKLNELTYAITNVTNRFSVSLYKPNEFLFFGDLAQAEMKQCITQLFLSNGGKNKIKVKYLITPHHGTHSHYWNQIGKYIEPEYVISSNGKKHILHYTNDYINLANKKSHCTYYGTFDSERLNK